jgi:glycosyltransferase involved in cell wall biosynthesis
LKILFITDNLNYARGITTHLLNLTEELGKEKDIRTFIICGEAKGISLFKNIKVNIYVNKNFLYHRRSYLNYARSLAYLVRFVKQNEIDIIHSQTHYTANLAYHASKYGKVKTIQTIHGVLQTQGRLRHFRCDNLIAIDKNIHDYLLSRNFFSSKHIYFIRCGIHVPVLPPKKNPIELKIIAASRFVQENGIDVFIKAVSSLPDADRRKTEFFIAGEGELESYLKELNEELGARIKFLGRVDDMPALLRSTHIFVFTSHANTGGFPLAITEAAAYNNLIISSSIDGIESVLIRDIDGLIFNKGDGYDLMIKIKLAIDGYKTFRPVAEHFYCKVKELFGINTMIQKHLELYEQCLKGQ